MSRAILNAHNWSIRLKSGCPTQAAPLHRSPSAPGSAFAYVETSYQALPILPGSLFPPPRMTGRPTPDRQRASQKYYVVLSVSLVSIAVIPIRERFLNLQRAHAFYF